MYLHKSDFERVRQLLNKHNSHYPLLEAVIQGDLAGQIFVDDFQNMKSAFILNRLYWFYVIGDINNEVVIAEMIRVLSEKKSESYPCWGAGEKFKNEVISNVTSNVKILPRYQFAFHQDRFHALPVSESSLCIKKISEENYEALQKKYASSFDFWDSKKLFLNKGFGFILEDNGNSAALILSASVTNTEAEIDIHTDEAYRGKGFAKQLSIAFIKECLRRNILPKWDCDIDNAASIRSAESLGFEKIETYPLLFIS